MPSSSSLYSKLVVSLRHAKTRPPSSYRKKCSLAVDSEAYAELFYDISGRILLDVNQIKLIVVDADREEITEWIS
jgi:hypothetical protein